MAGTFGALVTDAAGAYILSNNHVLADEGQLPIGSPIFQPASFISGFTQYGDAIQRAEFWNVGGSGSYHVLLGQPRVLPTLTFQVPLGDGFTGRWLASADLLLTAVAVPA